LRERHGKILALGRFFTCLRNRQIAGIKSL
jgi:hypothetical protein